MMLLVGIELSTSPLPKHCIYARSLILLAFSTREMQLFAVGLGLGFQLLR